MHAPCFGLPHRLLLLTLHQHHVLLHAGAARQQLSTVLLSYLSASAACAAGGPLLLQLQQALAQYLQGVLLPALQHSGEAVPKLLAGTPVLAGRLIQIQIIVSSCSNKLTTPDAHLLYVK